MRRFFIVTIIILLFPLAVRAQEVSLTLEEAINLALRENRSIRLQAEEIEKSKAKVAEARGGFLPTLNATATQSQTRQSFEEDLNQTTAQLTLKQYLYKGGKTFNALRKNQFDLDAQEASFEKIQLEIILEVKKAFYALLLGHEFVNLNRMILDNTQGHLNYVETLYHNGHNSELDLLRIKDSFSSVQEAYQESVHQTEALQALLRNLLYIDEKTLIKPNETLVYDPQTLVYEEGFLKAMENRPEIKYYDSIEKADRKAVEMSKADNRPSVYASWDYYARSHAAATAEKNWSDYNVVGLTVSWPVFDGWATKAKVEQAIVDLKQTQLTKDKFVKDMALELKQAYLDFQNAINQVKTAEAECAYYVNNYLTAQQKFEKGLLSVLDMDDTLVSRQVAFFNKSQAIYNYLIAQSEFEKAIGEK